MSGGLVYFLIARRLFCCSKMSKGVDAWIFFTVRITEHANDKTMNPHVQMIFALYVKGVFSSKTKVFPFRIFQQTFSFLF
jgi:hypothetical protein